MDITNYIENCESNLLIKSDIADKLKEEECILGIDEAGRGPVLGPMVYASCLVPISCEEELKSLGCDDSKVLKEEERNKLFKKLNDETQNYVGWMVHILSPQTISTSMLSKTKYNLNALSHDTAIGLIREAVKEGVKVKKVFVDTVGPPATYQAKLQKIFPNINVVVEKKADSKFPIVSAASICAKVCRDKAITNWHFKENPEVSRKYGSGYTSDPVTKTWLRQSVDHIFGFPTFVRFSWSTAKNVLDTDAASVEWPDDEDEDNKTSKSKKIKSYFASQQGHEQPSEVHWFFSKNKLSPATSL